MHGSHVTYAVTPAATRPAAPLAAAAAAAAAAAFVRDLDEDRGGSGERGAQRDGSSLRVGAAVRTAIAWPQYNGDGRRAASHDDNPSSSPMYLHYLHHLRLVLIIIFCGPARR